MWDKEKINYHIKAAKLLDIIKNEIFDYIKNNQKVTEFQVQQFILSRFKNYNLKTDTFTPIVSFGGNTSLVHYYASAKNSKRLQLESLIMVDIWARLNKKGAPFADITWMGYYGKKIPTNMQNIFNIVVASRNLAIVYIKNNLKKNILPTGKEVDIVSRNYIKNAGFEKQFLHGTGHPLGFINDHGKGVYLNRHGQGKLSKIVGYTIEPGIYIKNKFGFRSEIDFYIDDKMRLKISTGIQEKIILIKPIV